MRNLLEVFWYFGGNFLDFLEIFLDDFFGGIFWEGFFGGVFLEEFFWRIFLEEFFGRNFLGGFFGRTLLKSAKLFELFESERN